MSNAFAHWLDGLPFPGAQVVGNDNGTQKYWSDGLPAQPLFTGGAVDQTITGAAPVSTTAFYLATIREVSPSTIVSYPGPVTTNPKLKTLRKRTKKELDELKRKTYRRRKEEEDSFLVLLEILANED